MQIRTLDDKTVSYLDKKVREKMDKTLLKTKFMDIYFSTLQVGVGVFFVPEHKTLHITLLVLEFCFYFGGEVEDGNDI